MHRSARGEDRRGGARPHAEYVLQRLALQWVNDVLPGMARAASLHTDFCDGLRLVALAGAITGRAVVAPVLAPRTLADCLTNVRAAVLHVEALWKVVLDGVASTAIVRGDAQPTLELLAVLATVVSPKHPFVAALRTTHALAPRLRLRAAPPARRELVARARETHIAAPAPLAAPLPGEVGSALSASTLAAPAPSSPCSTSASTAEAAAQDPEGASPARVPPPRLRPAPLRVPLDPDGGAGVLSPFRAGPTAFTATDEHYFTPRHTRLTDSQFAAAGGEGGAVSTGGSGNCEENDHFSDGGDSDSEVSPVLVDPSTLSNPFEGLPSEGEGNDDDIEGDDLEGEAEMEDMEDEEDEEGEEEEEKEKKEEEDVELVPFKGALSTSQGLRASRRPRAKRMLCAKRNLCDLTPAMAARLPEAAGLDASRNALAAVPPAVLARGTHLRQLDLSSNVIAAVGDELAALTALRVLDIGLNSLAALPAAVWRLPALQALYAPYCQIAELNVPDEDTDTYAPLRVLVLTDNCLAALPRALGRVTTLSTLFVDHNALEALPRELTALTGLTELRLGANRLRALPPGTTRWQALRTLDVHANALDALPPEWFDGTHRAPPLAELFVQSNRIGELPVSFFDALPRLAFFDASRNALRFLPASIAGAHALQHLYVGHNRLARLPPSVGRLARLVCLDVACNRLERVPDLAGCTALAALVCGYNPLRAPPPALPPSLVELHLSGCGLTALPPTYRLPALTTLMLAANDLAALDLRGIVDPDVVQCVDVALNRLAAPPLGLHPADIAAGYVRLSCEGNPYCDTAGTKKGDEEDENAPVQPPVDPASCAPRLRVGCAAMQGDWQLMEDAVCVRGDVTGAGDTDFVALFDGHGGGAGRADAAPTAALAMCRHLETHLAAATDVRACLCAAVAAADAACAAATAPQQHQQQHQQCGDTLQGSTCLAALFCAPPRERPGAPAHVHIANVGNSRAVLCTAGRATTLTADHSPARPRERERIVAAGGFVGRDFMVQSALAVARTVGDATLHPFVCAEPDCVDRALGADDEFLVLACDGVWDGLTDRDAVAIVRAELARHGDPARAALVLRDTAYHAGTIDNITVIVVVFSAPQGTPECAPAAEDEK